MNATIQDAASQNQPSAEARALIALHKLLIQFIDATDGPDGYPDSLKAMSMNQIHLFNKLHLAMGL